MSDDTVFTCFPVYRALPDRCAELDKDVAAKELDDLLDGWSDRVETRGIYSTAAFRPDADLMFWWVSESADLLQELTVEVRRTALGRALEQTQTFMGVVRPAEFAPDHRPAFVEGKPPKRYLCTYPFVRTPEWYLLDPKERGAHLRSHGELGRDYPDVFPNTTSAFGLGDYEWILAFEADRIDRLVDLIRHLRANESRLFVKLEVPFVTGIRKDARAAIDDLP